MFKSSRISNKTFFKNCGDHKRLRKATTRLSSTMECPMIFLSVIRIGSLSAARAVYYQILLVCIDVKPLGASLFSPSFSFSF